MGTITTVDGSIREKIEEGSFPLNHPKDLDPLIDRIGDAHYVLLGEASHGTHEYYTWRFEISKRLIEEKGFSFIAVEGDWPDCYEVNRYIKGYKKSGDSAESILRNFDRWPTWMWANWEIVALAEWLKNYNDRIASRHRIGFYGLDVYSLGESLKAIIEYLDREDPQAAHTARKVVACFDTYGGSEGQKYAMATRMVPHSCEEEVIKMLLQITSNMDRYDSDPEVAFSTQQNASVARNAERYYRAMVGGGPESWNIRDRHMVDALENLVDFHGRDKTKCIVWEHNTHIGDARATGMTQGGMVNVGQLIRESHMKDDVVLVGFGSYQGTVIAGGSWGAPMQEMDTPPAREDSWEDYLHQLVGDDKLILLPGSLGQKFYHRAIGVVYNPGYDHINNYVLSDIAHRYNAFIYLDETQALHPLHMKPHSYEAPDTYPWGF